MTLAKTMWAMALAAPGCELALTELPMPVPKEHEILVKVLACGVCRTDLHIVDGDLPAHRAGIVPGHEIVGRVVTTGLHASMFRPGDRVGIPWLGGTCGQCRYCLHHEENLCDSPTFTGYDRHGGFAQYAVADERYSFLLPAQFDDVHAAPLLCAGLIGYRAYRMSGVRKRENIGLYGFGAAAHILCQLAVAEGVNVYAFLRPGDERGEAFARELGAYWVGTSDQLPASALDAALIFAPVGSLVPAALRSVRKGGTVVCAGIHMSKIPAMDYRLLWGERCVRSVANLTREDGDRFFALVKSYGIQTTVHPFRLTQANEAIAAVRAGLLNGAAVIVP